MCRSNIHQFLNKMPPRIAAPVDISIVEADCLVLAESIRISEAHTKASQICVLNMANDHYVGGDYLTSTGGQEESIIRRSNLLENLVESGITTKGSIANPFIYRVDGGLYLDVLEHRRQGFGDLASIFTESVDIYLPGREVTTVNILSSSAINLTEHVSLPYEVYLAATILKIVNQLRVAKMYEQEVLILGAFGCGAFRNDPSLIARLYHSILDLPEFRTAFRQIIFAILPDSPSVPTSNLEVFRREFQMTAPGMIEEILPELNICHYKGLKDTASLCERYAAVIAVESIEELYARVMQILLDEQRKQLDMRTVNIYRQNLLNHLIDELTKNPASVVQQLQNITCHPDYRAGAYGKGIFSEIRYRIFNQIDRLLGNYLSYSSLRISPPAGSPVKISAV